MNNAALFGDFKQKNWGFEIGDFTDLVDHFTKNKTKQNKKRLV